MHEPLAAMLSLRLAAYLWKPLLIAPCLPYPFTGHPFDPSRWVTSRPDEEIILALGATAEPAQDLLLIRAS